MALVYWSAYVWLNQPSRAVLQWQDERAVGWHYIVPGKPVQNALVENLT